MNIFQQRSDLDITFRKIIENPYRFKDSERIDIIQKQKSLTNPYNLHTLIIALNDPCREVRKYALKLLYQHGQHLYSHIYLLLGNYSLYSRNYAAILLGKWSTPLHRKRWYEILQESSIVQRTQCVKKYITRVSTTSVNSNEHFDAVIALELIGDFRALSILQHTSVVLKSQITYHTKKHTTFALFLICLRFLQHPEDIELKNMLLETYLLDLIQIAEQYKFIDVFNQIFNQLGLASNIISEISKFNLRKKIEYVTHFPLNSWASMTIIKIISRYYPISLQLTEDILYDIQDHVIRTRLERLRLEIINAYQLPNKKGLKLIL